MPSESTISKEELRNRRKALGLTQEDIAAQFGVDRTTVARWETGRRAIDPLVSLALEGLEGRLKKNKKK